MSKEECKKLCKSCKNYVEKPYNGVWCKAYSNLYYRIKWGDLSGQDRSEPTNSSITDATRCDNYEPIEEQRNMIDKVYKEYIKNVSTEITVLVKKNNLPESVIPVLVEKSVKPYFFWLKEQ